MSQPLFIHEFSTGITPEGSQEKWVSKGFTGRYMNMTMNEIPTAVERAIANNGFAVAEGASSDQPAIIGRSIPDSDQSSGWAVVALVTRGEDEYGRSFGFHRYFLCPGSDRLWMLVEWIEAYRSQNGQYPIFNPYKSRTPGNPTKWQEPAPYQPLSADMLSPGYEPIPFILPCQLPIMLAKLHQLAQFKAETQQGQVSWAYNVEALEQPSRFLVIKPASAKAEQILRQPVVASTRTVNASIEIDEQAIKGAIKGLINSAQVNQDLVEVIISNIPVVEKALKTEAEATKYWEQLFDGQGAANGISQNIMTSQMVRLLAIRSIVLPERLPQYLAWLKVEKADQVSSSMQDSMRFQQQICREMNIWRSSKPDLHEILEDNVFEGIKASLLDLYRSSSRSQEKKKSVSIEPMIWLLKSTQGLWGSLTSTVVDSLGEMLQQIYDGSYQKAITDARRITAAPASEGTNMTGSRMIGGMSAVSKSQPSVSLDKSKGWQEIWNRIMQHRNHPSKGIRRLSLFGDLFSAVGHYHPLSACFYQLSLGEVPADIYSQNQRTFGQSSPSPYGIGIYRQPTKLERFARAIRPYLLGVAALACFSPFAIWLGKRNEETPPNPPGPAHDSPRTSPVADQYLCEEIREKIDIAINDLNDFPSKHETDNKPSLLEDAIKSFDKPTKNSIKAIIANPKFPKELANYKLVQTVLFRQISSDYVNIKKECNEILNLDLDQVSVNSDINQPPSRSDARRWIAAIYLYQQFKGTGADGIIASPSTDIGAELSSDYGKLIKELSDKATEAKTSQKPQAQSAPKSSTNPSTGGKK
jgi:hypothetical protein